MTRGGYARPATLIAKEARKKQGTVLILDAGDYSMGTTFAAAIRETGCRFQLKPNVSSGAGSLAGTRTQPTPGLDIRSHLRCVQDGSQRIDGRHGDRVGARGD